MADALTSIVPHRTLPAHLATSYGPRGATMGRDGRPWPHSKLTTVGQLAPRDRDGAWKAPPGMCQGLEDLDAAMKAAGSAGVRLTEVTRPVERVRTERAKYDTWVEAGRPSPGTPRYQSRAMRTVYIAPPNFTNHQWGGAVDFHVYALDFPGLKGNAALSKLWDLAIPLGFTPIIKNPSLEQSECWHFDRLGPLAGVRAAFVAHRNESPDFRNAYGLTAMVGNVLVGTFTGTKKMERYVQCRLLLAGHWPGPPDGQIGPKTRKALKAAGVEGVRTRTSASVIVGLMDEAGVGLPELALL